MSKFVKAEVVRAIKIGDKTYRTAHQAARVYADTAVREFIRLYISPKLGDAPIGYSEYMSLRKPIHNKFYRRAHKIFTRYFKGE